MSESGRLPPRSFSLTLPVLLLGPFSVDFDELFA
jgi:hypothetical protein